VETQKSASLKRAGGKGGGKNGVILAKVVIKKRFWVKKAGKGVHSVKEEKKRINKNKKREIFSYLKLQLVPGPSSKTYQGRGET